MPNFGDKILVRNRLEREEEWWPDKRLYEKVWKGKKILEQEAIFLGFRTLSNGLRYNDFTYKPKEYFKAALVCTSEHENPFYTTDF